MKNTFISIALVILSCSVIRAQSAGSFTRLGFGARGMGMGNALTSVTTGEMSAYYNPALVAFAQQSTGTATFGILSLDRSLNFLSYVQPIQPRGGFSAGIINSGVRNIDGRDNDGYHTDTYSTTENQFFFAFANRVADEVSLGVSVKVYYAKLFDQVSTTTVGFDVGGLFQVTPDLSLGAAVKDIGSKYKWDTTPLYGTDGQQTEDDFPTMSRIAISYTLLSKRAVISAEYENSSDGGSIFRAGAEYALVDHFSLRGGIDRIDFSDNATGAKPSFGFTARSSFGQWTPVLDYAFVVEPFSPQGMHIISLSLLF